MANSQGQYSAIAIYTDQYENDLNKLQQENIAWIEENTAYIQTALRESNIRSVQIVSSYNGEYSHGEIFQKIMGYLPCEEFTMTFKMANSNESMSINLLTYSILILFEHNVSQKQIYNYFLFIIHQIRPNSFYIIDLASSFLFLLL